MLLLLLEDKENAKMNCHKYTCLAVSSVNKGGRHENISVFITSESEWRRVTKPAHYPFNLINFV